MVELYPSGLPTYYDSDNEGAIEYSRVDHELGVAILPGNRKTFHIDYSSATIAGTWNPSNASMLADSDARLVVLKKLFSGDTNDPDDFTNQIVGMTIDYSGYFRKFFRTMEQVVEQLTIHNNTLKNIDSDFVEQLSTHNDTLANIDSEAHVSNVYNERKKITRLILDFNPVATGSTESIDTTSDSEERTVVSTVIKNKIFVEHEIINGPNGQGICFYVQPVEYKRKLGTQESFFTDKKNDSDGYERSDNEFEVDYMIVDLISASGGFYVGETVTGNLTGYSTTIKDIVYLEGTAQYSTGGMTSATLETDSPLTIPQQRALVVSALKQSGTLTNLIAEIQSPTQLPG
jgi:hypothetical protein